MTRDRGPCRIQHETYGRLLRTTNVIAVHYRARTGVRFPVFSWEKHDS